MSRPKKSAPPEPATEPAEQLAASIAVHVAILRQIYPPIDRWLADKLIEANPQHAAVAVVALERWITKQLTRDNGQP